MIGDVGKIVEGFSQHLRETLDGIARGLGGEVAKATDAHHAANITRLIEARIRADHANPVGYGLRDYEQVLEFVRKIK